MKIQNNTLQEWQGKTIAPSLRILLTVILSIFLISLVSAEIPTYKQNQSVPLTAVCNNCTYVNLTKVENQNGIILLGQYAMTKNGTNYNYTFSDTNTLGTYKYVTCGNLDGILTCEDTKERSFEITPNGQNFSTGKAISYIGFIVLLLFIFILTIWGALKINWKHPKNDEDKIISMNNFRYIKVFLFCMAYMEVMFLFGLSYKFFNEANIEGFTEFFNFVYQLFLNLLYPIIILTIIIFFLIWINNRKLIKKIKLGL